MHSLTAKKEKKYENGRKWKGNKSREWNVLIFGVLLSDM